jgi:hypothetical protein
MIRPVRKRAGSIFSNTLYRFILQQPLKPAARKAADGYRAYRSSWGDDALEEADYARNEQAQARREAQEHLDEVAVYIFYILQPFMNST